MKPNYREAETVINCQSKVLPGTVTDQDNSFLSNTVVFLVLTEASREVETTLLLSRCEGQEAPLLWSVVKVWPGQ